MTSASDQGSDRQEQEIREAQALLASDPAAAESCLRQLIAAYPDRPRPYRLLAAALMRLGRSAEAERVQADGVEASARLPALIEAARAVNAFSLPRAEQLVRAHLTEDPDDPEALRLLAEIAARTGHVEDAESLLRKALELAPAFTRARVNLATLLHQAKRSDEALAEFDRALTREPGSIPALSLKSAFLMAERRMDEALKAHEELVARAADAAVPWMNYGYVLKTLGRSEQAIAAYRKSLALDPGSGFAWWGLANLRTVRFDREDVETMRRALRSPRSDLDRVQLHFALGRALGDQGDFRQSFEHFAEGNALRTILTPYDPHSVAADVRKAEGMFTAAFVEARRGGCDARDPIFILGMPRSGSTLVEQILSSHPDVEGLDELQELPAIAARIAGPQSSNSWLDRIAALAPEGLRSLGESYLSAARAYRTTDRPFFTDKLPSNWQLVGLIRLILPNARIVDVRRHPLACCFSNFTLYFNSRTNFASSLEDLGRYYRAYVRMMAHFDAVQPGRVHRLLYERLVGNPEEQIRILLDRLGLPFDDACLRFHENRRAVHTPSAEQVRRPIDRAGLERWRDYEPWLAPLKRSLGSVLDSYPEVPEDLEV